MLRFHNLLLSLVCSLILSTTLAVPKAHAGIFSFLKRHIFGQHCSASTAPKAPRHKALTHNKKLSSRFAWKSHKAAPRLTTTGSDIPTVAQELPQSQPLQSQPVPRPLHLHAPLHLIDSDAAAIFAAPPPLATPDTAFAGKASWYGPGFAGKRTASGQIFNPVGLTAASRTLPLGSRMLVANPQTGRCCTVTINDRGPYVRGRDIDLSKGAAARIGVTGVSPVVCVAYASNKAPIMDRLYQVDGPRAHGRKSSHRQWLAANRAVSEKVTGKVFKLNADVLPDEISESRY
ncbi:MAG: septal ring lytic transglycosylase RlpA family protein [Cyanobacteria bacterium REEB67]|nr:septal ring lytic transglycosylase RlpA family protein [Cyanobacteria bacterium REEB67]